MRFALFGIMSMALLSIPLPGFAQDNSGCDFAAPAALLQAQAYRGYKLQRAADNAVIESGDISKDVHFQIQQSQCVDFVVRNFTFTLKSTEGVQPLALAIREISGLKLSDVRERPNDLLAFLKSGYQNGGGNGFSACKDGSSAPPGECTWESLGGFSFEVSREKSKLIISVTEYSSG